MDYRLILNLDFNLTRINHAYNFFRDIQNINRD